MFVAYDGPSLSQDRRRTLTYYASEALADALQDALAEAWRFAALRLCALLMFIGWRWHSSERVAQEAQSAAQPPNIWVSIKATRQRAQVFLNAGTADERALRILRASDDELTDAFTSIYQRSIGYHQARLKAAREWWVLWQNELHVAIHASQVFSRPLSKHAANTSAYVDALLEWATLLERMYQSSPLWRSLALDEGVANRLVTYTGVGDAPQSTAALKFALDRLHTHARHNMEMQAALKHVETLPHDSTPLAVLREYQNALTALIGTSSTHASSIDLALQAGEDRASFDMFEELPVSSGKHLSQAHDDPAQADIENGESLGPARARYYLYISRAKVEDYLGRYQHLRHPVPRIRSDGQVAIHLGPFTLGFQTKSKDRRNETDIGKKLDTVLRSIEREEHVGTVWDKQISPYVKGILPVKFDIMSPNPEIRDKSMACFGFMRPVGRRVKVVVLTGSSKHMTSPQRSRPVEGPTDSARESPYDASLAETVQLLQRRLATWSISSEVEDAFRTLQPTATSSIISTLIDTVDTLPEPAVEVEFFARTIYAGTGVHRFAFRDVPAMVDFMIASPFYVALH